MEKKDIEKRKLVFDQYSNTDENGVEYWLARDIMKPLGYTQWRNFETTIKRAMVSCETAKTPVQNHFAEVSKMVSLGSGSTRKLKDYKLTRYACYLIAQNGDPRKDEIALAQAYFAIKARTQELIEQRVAEIQRLQSRKALSETEKQLASVVFERGVDSRGFARIKSQGDRALFGGHDTKAMKKRLGVSDRKPLADVLPDVTLAAKNLAGAMTAHNVAERDLHGVTNIQNEHVGNNVSVRSTLVERGIYPESLPAEEDTKKVERRLKADERSLPKSEKGFLQQAKSKNSD